MKYKINIHAHTIFSDGLNTPYVMAVKAKQLGFTALVITDHYYGPDTPFLTQEGRRLQKKAIEEAKHVLSVIVGIEIPFMGQEILVFGGAAIDHILRARIPPYGERLEELKRNYNCATVLCHPGADYEKVLPYVDAYDSGNDFFKDRTIPNGLQGWCNSDAHLVSCLKVGYNIVDTKIENENQLIKYIKSDKQPEFIL